MNPKFVPAQISRGHARPASFVEQLVGTVLSALLATWQPAAMFHVTVRAATAPLAPAVTPTEPATSSPPVSVLGAGVSPVPGDGLAWGFGYSGELGDGTFYTDPPRSSASPVSVAALPGGRKLCAVSGGSGFSLALANDATLWAWGTGQFLGSGTWTNSAVPIPVNTLPGGRTPSQIASGLNHNLVLATDGRMSSWGNNGWGQLGNGGTTDSNVPVLVSPIPANRKAVAIAAGAFHNIALADDGSMWAWGDGAMAQLGNNSLLRYTFPVPVTPSWGTRKIVGISAGAYHNVVVCDDGSAWAWGYGAYGQIGNDVFYPPAEMGALVPVPVLRPAGRTFVTVACGAYHNIALLSDGTLWSWGRGADGELGNGSLYPSAPYGLAVATPVAALPGAGHVPVEVVGGLFRSFCIASDGFVWGWGYNLVGQLGDGTYTTRPAPVALAMPAGKLVRAIGTGIAGSHTLAITENNDAPTATPQSLITPEDTPLALVLSGSDPEGQTLTYSIQSAPGHGSLSGTGSALTYTPATNYNGPDSFTFKAVDAFGAASTAATISISITPVPDLPNLINPGTKSVNEGTALSFAVLATDPDGDALTYSIGAGSVSGMSINPTSGAFSWTPSEAQGPGTYTVTLRAAETATPTRYDEETITIGVNEVNAAPVVSTPTAVAAPEQTLIAYAVAATDPDLPAQTLHYSLVAGPAGAAINATSGAFTWTPSEAQGPGTYGLTFAVTDGVASTQVTTSVTVNEVNAAPVLPSPGNKTINELASLTFTLAATDSDIPATPLAYSFVTGKQSGMTLDSATGAFAWTPTEAQGQGTYLVTFRATDSGTPAQSSDATVQITVNEVNTPPILASPGNRSVDELAALTFTLSATDTDLPPNLLTYSISNGGVGDMAVDAATGVFHWVPNESHGPGSYPVTFSVSDGAGGANEKQITITVNEVPSAPVLAFPGNKSIAELSPLSFTLSATDPDVPAETLTYSIQAGEVGGMSLNPATGAFNWTPTESQGPGLYTVTFRATDSHALFSDQTISIDVDEVNAIPVLTGVPTEATIPELVAYSFDAAASDSDSPAQDLTFSLVGAPAGATINANTGLFTWMPTEAQGPADYSFAVRVSDGVVHADLPVTLHVTEVNTAPVLADPGDKAVSELSTLSFTLTATDGDVPANSRTFSIFNGALQGMALSATSGAFTWTPAEVDGPGSYTVTFRVTDNGTPALHHDQAVTISVAEVNTAPVLLDPGSKTVNELATLAFSLSAFDADRPANPLAYSIAGGRETGMHLNATTGAFDWIPNEAQGGATYHVTFRVSDGLAAVDREITITVPEVNVAPALSGVPAGISGSELSLFTFHAMATDSDLPAQPLVFSLVGAPAGASIDPNTGDFSWIPSELQGPGRYVIGVRVTDGLVAIEDSVAVDVAEFNSAPVLTDPGDRAVDELTTVSLTLSGTDADVPANALTYAITGGLRAGMTLTPGGVFTWTPTELEGPGDYDVTFRATDNGTPAKYDEETVRITVREVNRAPALANPGDKSIAELTPLSFALNATDPDLPANAVTFSIHSGLVDGMALNPTTGEFTWTPSEAQGPHAYSVTFRATDEHGASAEQAITITVTEVNSVPVLADVPTEATIPELAAFSFDAAASDSDDPVQLLTFSLVDGPAGATIDANTGLFTWTPGEPQGPGDYAFHVRVSDGIVHADLPVTLHVAEVNAAPAFTGLTDKAVDELMPLSFAVTATDPDFPANTLTYAIVDGLRPGMTLGPSSGTFAWTPGELDGGGNYAVTVRVTDNGQPALQAHQEFRIAVKEVNAPPTLGNVPPSATIPEWVACTFQAAADDPDVPAQTLTFSLVGAPAGAAIDPASGLFTWTPAENQGPGTYPFAVRVSDGLVQVDAPITVQVTEVNSAPALANPGNRTLDELTPLSFALAGTDGDWPANTLTYSLASGGLPGMTLAPDTGAFAWTPAENQGPGTYAVAFRVVDNGMPPLEATTQINITVNEANAAPTLAHPGNKVVDELTPLAFKLSATDDDLPLNTLTFAIGGGAETGMELDPASGAFAWTPTEQQGPHTYNVTFRVTDNGTPARSDERTIAIAVHEVNSVPVLSDVPAEATIPELVPFAFDAAAADADYPAQTLTFALVGGPPGAMIDANTGRFEWTPAEADGPADHTFAVRVSDGVVHADLPVTLHVLEVNTAPVLVGPGGQAVDELTTLSFSLVGKDTDLPANALAYAIADGALPGMSLNGSTGAFTWTPAEDQGPGTFHLKVRVTDNGDPALSDEEEITINVREVNTRPALTSPGNRTVNEETAVSFVLGAADVDIPPNALTFAVAGGWQAGMTLNAQTGAFAWTPAETQGPGAYEVTFRATDNGTPAMTDEKTVTLTVNEVNRPPTLTNPGDRLLMWGVPLSFTLAATDPDYPPNVLTYAITSGKLDGMALDASTGAFSWTPTSAQIGAAAVTFQVADAAGLTATQSIDITVGKRATKLVYTGAVTAQYSDAPTLSAKLTDDGGGAANNSPIGDRSVGFAVGTQAATATTNAMGIASPAAPALTQAPAAVTVTAKFAGDALYLPSSDSAAFTIRAETADVVYSGGTYFSTANSSSTVATLALSATATDDADGAGGDIRKARIEFHLGSRAGPLLGGAALPVGLIDPADLAVGTATTPPFNYTLTNADFSNGGTSLNVYTIATAWYTDCDPNLGCVAEPDVITIVVPGTENVSAGGQLIMTHSEGTVAADPGTKCNIGCTMKFNKSGRNLHGQINIILRSGGRVLQIKSNAVDSLATTGSNYPRQATIVTKANLADITDPLAPVSLGGNLSLQLRLADNGSGGQTDQIAITLTDSRGGTLFSSHWSGAKTELQTLAGGNVSVR